MSTKPKLVIGANGFLGSHVTRQLVADGAEVRAMVRPTANTRAIDDLQITRCTRFHGDVFDTDTVREAMDGVDDVYYCVVDTRAWLRDPSPLFRTNVEGLRNVLDVAVKEPDLRRFVFTSTYATVGRRHGHVATEEDIIDPRGLTPVRPIPGPGRRLGDAIRGRSRAARRRDVRLDDVRQRDWGGTPHGAFIAGAVFGKLPFLMNGIQLEVVGVDDAARAMILAAERGRIGERYLVSERMIALNDVVRIAAEEAGVPPPRRSISVPMLFGLGALGSLRARLTGKDAELSLASVRMTMRAEAPVDHSKAVRELGWRTTPVEESIREAARFWAAMRTVRKNSAAAQADRLGHVERIRVDLPRTAANHVGDVVRQGPGRRLPGPDSGRSLRQGDRRADRLRLDEDRDRGAQFAVGDDPNGALRRLGSPISCRAFQRRCPGRGLRPGQPIFQAPTESAGRVV